MVICFSHFSMFLTNLCYLLAHRKPHVSFWLIQANISKYSPDGYSKFTMFLFIFEIISGLTIHQQSYLDIF